MTETITSSSPCRICMDAKIQQVSIFSGDLSRKVSEIADVQVQEGDGLPPSICEDCEIDLERCYRFRTQIIWADTKFRERLSVSEVVFEECHIKQEGQTFINEENQEDDDDDRPPSDNDDDDYDMRDDSGDKIDEIPQEKDQPTDPIDHVEIIENRTKQELHNLPSTDGNSQDEPLIVAQMKRENEPSSDPLMQSESQQPMDTESSIPGPSTSTPTVKRTLLAAALQNWPDRSNKFVSDPNKQTVNRKESTNPSYSQWPIEPIVPYLVYLGMDNLSNRLTDDGILRPETNDNSQRLTLQPTATDSVEPPPQNTNLLLLEPKSKQPQPESEISQLEDEPLESRISRLSGIESPTKFVINKSRKRKALLKSAKGSTGVKRVKKVLPSITVTTTQSANETDNTQLPSCLVCNVNFLSEQLFNDHLMKSEFICRVCTVVVKTHQELETHFSTHTPYKCKVCKELFWCYQDLYRHRKTSSSCSTTTVTCDFCEKPFLNKKDLNLHKRKFHTGDEEEQQCVICEKKFALRQQLDCHMRSVHVVHEYVECRFCQKLCLGPDRLKKHVKFSHVQSQGDELFPCTVCGKVFFNKMCLLSHKNVHDESMSLCELCGRSIKKKSMYDHIRREHHNPGYFRCDPCNKVFNTEKKLRNHLNSSTKHKASQNAPVVCEICGKPYKTARILAAHLATHSDEKPFKCEICGAAFKQKVTLTTHHRTHTNASKYRCGQCGLSFKWKSTFDNHRKRCTAAQIRETYDYSPATLMML